MAKDNDKDAYWNGFDAACHGATRECPYLTGSGLLAELNRLWLRGYDRASLIKAARTSKKKSKHAYQPRDNQI